MASLRLDVPLVAQESSLTCWHASAQMIWWYWQGITERQGPMNTLGGKYGDNKPATPSDFILLAQTVGLKAVPRSGKYDPDTIHGLLTDHGPLWCAGYWYGYGHIMVLTGVDSNDIFMNDPEHGGAKKKHEVGWFNTKLANTLPGCLMCKDPDRY